MRKIIILSLLVCQQIYAQTEVKNDETSQKGLLIGLGVGLGTLTLNYHDTTTVKLSTTLPNIKIGYRFNKKTALCILLPGANYKYQAKDRGFEAFIAAVQYSLKPHWWTLLGTGITFDAPAFYTVKDPKKAAFYTGLPAITFATGYTIWQKKSFNLDLQYRLFVGKSVTTNKQYRTGISNMLILGFNWKK